MVETSRGSFENHCRYVSLIIMNDFQQNLSCQFRRDSVAVCDSMDFCVSISERRHVYGYTHAFAFLYVCTHVHLHLCLFLHRRFYLGGRNVTFYANSLSKEKDDHISPAGKG